ncbi:serpin family protein [Streptomyces sp. 2P-4]|uniref:serpin family protein n=1 Tax=Streptomyces sp. 2P-4 TaxID=2931974 RepID=UPI002540DD8A|nr:serpin family protein [Streptomyces sp. 2P-4]
MSTRDATVRAVNRLTGRWAEAAVAADGRTGTVLTAAGVWPLLALLADGAGGPARAELAEALGIPAGRAAGAARELLAALGRVRGLEAAAGLWTRADLPLEPEWAARLPEGARGALGGDPAADRRLLDEWAAARTGGLVERMPVELTEDTRLVLASALALRLRWIRPFREWPGTLREGPWAGREVVRLLRTTSLLHRVRVAGTPAGPVTVLEVVGDAGVDVHLVLGSADAPAGQVLAGGISAATRAVPSVDGFSLPEGTPGPGLRVGVGAAYRPEPRLSVDTVAFAVDAEHDLLEQAGLFGLETAGTREADGHFPGVTREPLLIGSGRQAAVARFHAKGFEAAAVTAFAAVGAGLLPAPPYRVRTVDVRFDRPFGFLAVQRSSRLVLAAGWVAEPLAYVAEEYAYDGEDEEWDEDGGWDGGE